MAGNDGVAVGRAITRNQAELWDRLSAELRQLEATVAGSRLGYLRVDAPTYATFIGAYRGAVAKVAAKCHDGAVIWSTLAQALHINLAIFEKHDEEAVTRLNALMAAAVDRDHPAHFMFYEAPR
ncbi:hypothetical protein [Asanoa siamensis]|uniref:Uncharacterized protein n=1 Tax=Asanoa siamensis TaxID=926357 RepID=A0ABQ4CSE7_9ACTN|nr:hypothetical protein [Asanoa siamensis]GIF73777.1 hypothetical protein Asi02nite_32950 [Asanoa siamensis]